jgi:hypothetical protein
LDWMPTIAMASRILRRCVSSDVKDPSIAIEVYHLRHRLGVRPDTVTEWLRRDEVKMISSNANNPNK